MAKEIAYKAAEVTRALEALAENAGNYAQTAEELRSDEENPLEIRAATLRTWRTETHVEQYRKLEENLGFEMEQTAVAKQRKLINKADEKLDKLLDKLDDVPADKAPEALRAAGDVKSKSSNTLMQLTGRPTNPRDNSSSDIVDLLKHMVDRGYLNLAPDVAASVEGTVDED